MKYVAESKILIAECTFYIAEHSDRADAGKHMHIDDFVSLIEKLNNEHIVITHTTQRTPMREIRKTLKETLPAEQYEKVILLMDKRRR